MKSFLTAFTLLMFYLLAVSQANEKFLHGSSSEDPLK